MKSRTAGPSVTARTYVIAVLILSLAAGGYVLFQYRKTQDSRLKAVATLAKDTRAYLGMAESYLESILAGGFRSYSDLSKADPYLMAAANGTHLLQDLDKEHERVWLDVQGALDEARAVISFDKLGLPPEWDSLTPQASDRLKAVRDLVAEIKKAFPEVSIGPHPRVAFDLALLRAADDAALRFLELKFGDEPLAVQPGVSVTRPGEDDGEGEAEEEPGGGIDAEVTTLFAGNGWTVSALLGTAQVTLPESLVTNVEDSPVKLYWMRAKALCDDVGYNLEDHLGKTVTVEICRVEGQVPEKYNHPAFSKTRGIVIRDSGGRVAGAFIDTGRHEGEAYTLSGRDLEDIAGIEGYGLEDYWRDHYLDENDPVNVAAVERSAEEVIKRYFEGMITGHAAKQLSTLSVEQKMHSLYSNLDDARLFNDPPALYAYLESAEILAIEPYVLERHGDLKCYAVDMDARVKERSTLHDGRQTRFVLIGEENGMLCIFEDGTGP